MSYYNRGSYRGDYNGGSYRGDYNGGSYRGDYNGGSYRGDYNRGYTKPKKKRSGAKYTHEGKNGVPVISGWYIGKRVGFVELVGSIVRTGKSECTCKGKTFERWHFTFNYKDTHRKVSQWGLFNPDTQTVFFPDLGLTISPKKDWIGRAFKR